MKLYLSIRLVAPQERATTCRSRVRLAVAALMAPATLWAATAAARPGSAPAWSAFAAQAVLAPGEAAASPSWNVETGLRLKALEAQWYNTANGEDFDFARRTVDAVLGDRNWNAPGRSPYADALLGEQLMLLYQVTLKPAYYAAAKELRERLAPACGLEPESAGISPAPALPGTTEDCIARAFLAQYAAEFQRPQDFPALARSYTAGAAQTVAASSVGDNAARDPLFEMAWSASSLVDSLRCLPENGQAHAQALAALHRIAEQSLRAEASKSTSPSAGWLLTRALLKGVRLHYLPETDRAVAMRAWHKGLSAVRVEAGGRLVFTGSAAGQASLGAFLLASTEVDLAPGSSAGRGVTVLLDAWYNSQQRRNAAGQPESFHYKWNDFSDSGYSIFGHLLRSAGLKTETLAAAPTPQDLAGAAYYLIVSPDIPVKNPQENYMTTADADVIAAWVRRGGVLVLMENDPPNADIEHLNLLADRFGIHFDDVLHHHVPGEQVENGRIPVRGDGPLFHQAHTLYMKDTCAITLRGAATALLRDRGDVVMATARNGRGAVFAAVDPWLYNEYTDGRKKPIEIYRQFDNFAGGKELVRWLVQQRRPPQVDEQQKRKQ